MTTQPFINSDRRPLVMTSSSFAGTGRWASHSLGHNHATWEQMALSLPGVMLQNVSRRLLTRVGLRHRAERRRPLRLLRRRGRGAVRPLAAAGRVLPVHAQPLPPRREGAVPLLRPGPQRYANSRAAEVQPSTLLLYDLLRGARERTRIATNDIFRAAQCSVRLSSTTRRTRARWTMPTRIS